MGDVTMQNNLRILNFFWCNNFPPEEHFAAIYNFLSPNFPPLSGATISSKSAVLCPK